MKRMHIMLAACMITLMAGAASAQTLGFGVNPQGSLYYRIGVALTKLMSDKLAIKARVQPYSGSSTYIPLLNRNEVQLALVNVSDAVNATEGIDNFKGRPQPDLRLINVMFLLRFSFLVPKDSKIQRIRDVKGIRIPTGFTSQTTVQNLLRAVLASDGLTLSDVKPYPTPNVFKGTDLLGEGKVEAASTGAGIAAIQKADIKLRRRGGVRFLPIGPDVAAMNAIVPSSGVDVDPAPHLKGILKTTRMMAFRAFLTANTKASDEFVYKLLKTVHESKKELVAMTKALGTFNPNVMTFAVSGKQGPVKYHAGAIKYLKEVGQWPPVK